MMSLFASSKLSASKYGFAFHRIRGAGMVHCRSFAAAQIALFRPLAQQQNQARLARAPEPDYLAESNFAREPVPEDLAESIPARAPEPEYPPGSIRHDLPTSAAVPAYHRGSKFDRVPYWQKIGRWKNATEKNFLSHAWGTANDIQGWKKLFNFLTEALPENIPRTEAYRHIRTRDHFIKDVLDGLNKAPMSIKLPPHIISSINWADPLGDPLFRQFIPLKSFFLPDHPRVGLDSLGEKADSVVQGLIHRYHDKVLLLAMTHCPLYCRFCTRSYAVGGNTEKVKKCALKPTKSRWDDMFAYIASNPAINDVVVSGGDAYMLQPHQLRYIGDSLLAIPHIRRFRIATKGLAVCPSRTLDPDDDWTSELIRLVNRGKKCGKEVAFHTHFNHPNEFSWVTREAAQKLLENGVTVRNQTVLLRGVNDTAETMGALIRELADNNIIPYYVYQGDMVEGVEDLRTPLSTILSLEQQLRGTIGGHVTPNFIVDLPGGGGKRIATSYQSYDRVTGKSTFVAPGVKGGDKVYEYWDPLHSLPAAGTSGGGEARKEI